MSKANDLLRRAADYLADAGACKLATEICDYLESDEAMELGRLRAQVEILTTTIEAANLALAGAPIVSQLHRDAIKLLKDVTCQPTS